MSRTLLKNATAINEGRIFETDILLENGRIEKIATDISDKNISVVDLNGKWLMPGMIDDQVHFREPGLTHKADIFSESRAAVAGGITSFMEMPNTIPNTITQRLLQEKYDIAYRNSLANYSFFMGATNDNLEEVLKTNASDVCGVKVFMGSSTGNMLVDNEKTLDSLFSRCAMLIATHCEDEATIRKNFSVQRAIYGDDIPINIHPIIRSVDACYLSSSMAVDLAKKHETRLHILHISTAKELDLFRNDIPLSKKRITAEACIHHLWFCDADYAAKGSFIKWNPAVKTESDREALWKGLNDDRIDIIATDHAPHTLEEKNSVYAKAPSGGPMVQHAVLAILEKVKEGKISLERAVEKMTHSVATCFNMKDRGFIREGYWADLVAIDQKVHEVSKNNLKYKCGWSPMEGVKFSHSIDKTWVNGHLSYDDGKIIEGNTGTRLTFHEVK